MQIPTKYRSGKILSIIQAGNSILGHRALKARIEQSTTMEAGFMIEYLSIAMDMLATSYHSDGAGLAAPQIGKLLRMFVLTIHPTVRYPDPPRFPDTIIVNPVIRWKSDSEATIVEGCLSIPGFYAAVKRPESIWVQYLSFEPTSKQLISVKETELSGFVARVFLHEYDHLDGILFPQRVTDWSLCATEENRPRLLEHVRNLPEHSNVGQTRQTLSNMIFNPATHPSSVE